MSENLRGDFMTHTVLYVKMFENTEGLAPQFELRTGHIEQYGKRHTNSCSGAL